MQSTTNCMNKLKMIPIIIFLVLSINSTNGGTTSEDDYIAESQNSCFKSHDTLSCFKYRTLRYMSGMAVGNAWLFESDGKNDGNASTRAFAYDDGTSILKLVKIEKPFIGQDGEEFLAESRQLSNDSEFEKFIKFGKRQARNFLTSHGVKVGLPEGATAVTEDDESIDNEIETARKGDGRGKKKKLAILLPLLSLLSLLKIKLLLVPILLTVLFIKKILVLAALFLPTILSTLKICKVHQPHVSHHSQWTGGEQNAEYSSGYGGGYSSYPGGASPGYSKDWAASRAYSGYRPVFEAKQLKGSASDFLASSPNLIYPATANNQA